MISRLVSASTLSALLTALLLLLATPASAAPPNIPSAATASSQLNSIPTRSAGSMSGYSRDLFPHWRTVSGTCNAREVVLRRDGSNVGTDSECRAVSGTWYSPYEGATQTTADRIDIDHVVPLAEAWRSGASSWTTSRRADFANDLDGPQLIAVTDTVNQSKGDQAPDSWKPPRSAYWCTYARMWIGTKSKWDLSATSTEKSALRDMLARC